MEKIYLNKNNLENIFSNENYIVIIKFKVFY